MLDASLQKISHLIRCILLHVGGDVGVSVEGEARGEVAEDIGQRFHVHAVLQGHCCEGMPQIVESDAG